MVACTELLAWFVWRADSQHRILHSHAHTHTKTLETGVCVYVSLRLFEDCPEGAREPVAKGVKKKQYLDDK